jgi:hypothetical protein
MIWKALMLQDGALGKPDLPAAAALMRRAAEAGTRPMPPSASSTTRVPCTREGAPDVAAARTWFEAAAAEGNPDAIEFLRTGYHVGTGMVRPVGGHGTAGRRCHALAGCPAGGGCRTRPPAAHGHAFSCADGPSSRRGAPAVPVTPAVPLPPQRVMGQRLLPPPRVAAPTWTQPAVLSALLLTLVLGGALRQQRRRPPFFPMESDP